MTGNITAVQTGSGWDVDQTGTANLQGDLQPDGSIILNSKGAAAVAAALGGSILGETTGTEAGLLAAMAAMHLMGGGYVQIKYQTYPLTAPLPPYTNVTIVGAGWKPAYSDIPDSGSTQYGEGSRLLATGNFPIYQYNSGTYDPVAHTNTADLSDAAATALYGTGTAAQQAFSNTFITQSVFRNLCLDGGGVSPYGMIAGAMNKASFDYCNPAENVLFVNFTKDPFRFENFIHINMPKCRIFNCGSLGALGASSKTALLQPGNSDFDDLLGTIPSSNNLASRGLQVYARNGAIHNLIKLIKVQCNRFNQSSFSESITMTNGVADIAVGDLSKYTEELPFVFSATTGGLPDIVGGIGGTLYVLSRSGTSGAGTVQFSWQPGIAARVFTPNAGGTVTAYTYGFPAIEGTAYDTASVNQFTIGNGSDVESGGTAQIQFSNCLEFYCDAKTPTAVSARSPHIAVVGSPQGEIRGNSFPTVYLSKTQGGMASSGQVRKFGTMGQATGYMGIGMWKLLSGAFQINMNASADPNSSMLPTWQLDSNWNVKTRGLVSSVPKRFTAEQTIGWNFDVGTIVLDAAYTSGFTLSTIDANSVGTEVEVFAYQATHLKTAASQGIQDTITDLTMAAKSSVTLRATVKSGGYFWQLVGYSPSIATSNGTLT